jgi:hypothetical protein
MLTEFEVIRIGTGGFRQRGEVIVGAEGASSNLERRTSQIDRVTQGIHGNCLSRLPGCQEDYPVGRIDHGKLAGERCL